MILRFLVASGVLLAVALDGQAQVQLELDGVPVGVESSIDSIRLVNAGTQRRLEIRTHADDLRCAINPAFDGTVAPLALPDADDFVLAIDHLAQDPAGDGEYVIHPSEGSVRQLSGTATVLEVISNLTRTQTCDSDQPADCAVLLCVPGGTPVFSGGFETPPPPQVDFVASGSNGGQVVAGSGPGNAVISLTLANPAGVDAANNVVATIDESGVPAGVSLDSRQPSIGTIGAGQWAIPELAVGQTGQLVYQFTAPANVADGRQICVGVGPIGADEQVVNPGNDSHTECVNVIRRANLALAVNDPGDKNSGEQLDYLVQLDSLGPSNASGIQVSVQLTLPPGATLGTPVAVPGSYSNGLWTVGSLAPNPSTLPALILPINTSAMSADGTVRIDASITAANESDPVPGNDLVFDETMVTVVNTGT